LHSARSAVIPFKQAHYSASIVGLNFADKVERMVLIAEEVEP